MKARLTEINLNEVTAYLGVKGVIPSELRFQIEEATKIIKSISTPRLAYKIFDAENSILEDFLVGNDLKELLKNSHKIVLFCATLGIEIDSYLARLQVTDMAKSVIFDACCNGAIENVCDNFCADFEADYGNATSRFSPGYGDFPFEMQKKFADLLELQKKVGVTVTESGLLVPQKSVTAVFGISSKKENKIQKCSKCNLYNTCTLRKGDIPCGKQ